MSRQNLVVDSTTAIVSSHKLSSIPLTFLDTIDATIPPPHRVAGIPARDVDARGQHARMLAVAGIVVRITGSGCVDEPPRAGVFDQVRRHHADAFGKSNA